jgi:hypothetical protein
MRQEHRKNRERSKRKFKTKGRETGGWKQKLKKKKGKWF